MTAQDIIKNAQGFLTRSSHYVYWYGGKGQRCTQALLDNLSKSYPKIYTKKYIAACQTDIKNGKYCIDCSGLVCSCYGVSHVGTSQFSKHFKTTKTLSPGMILWRSGHCAIYIGDGKLIEAKGQAADIVESEYVAKEWSRFYYKEGVDYGENSVVPNVPKTETNKSKKVVVATKRVTPRKISWTVTASKLNLRYGPGTQYDIMDTLSKGETVLWYGYCDSGSAWILVVGHGKTGWVSKIYVC